MIWSRFDTFYKLIYKTQQIAEELIILRGTVVGKTSKTLVLPWFFKLDHCNDSRGALHLYGDLTYLPSGDGAPDIITKEIKSISIKRPNEFNVLGGIRKDYIHATFWFINSMFLTNIPLYSL